MWFLDGNSRNIGAKRHVLDGLNLFFSLVHSFMAETENGDIWDGLNSFSCLSYPIFSSIKLCGSSFLVGEVNRSCCI